MTAITIDEQQIDTADEADLDEASVRSPHEQWVDRQTARARADVEDAFARGALRFASHPVHGPMMIAARGAGTDDGRRTMTIGDLAVTLCSPRIDPGAAPKRRRDDRRG